MKILAISYLYPNLFYPHYGIFVHNRLKAISKYHEVKVINPIPWFPGCGELARYKNYDKIPLKESIDKIEVYHPRFLTIPKVFKFIDAFTYKVTTMSIVDELSKSYPFDIVDLHWTYPDLPTGYALKKKYNKKMLLTLRGKEAFHERQGIGRELLIKKYLLNTDGVISLSQELQDIAIDLGVEVTRCRVVRNGVDTNSFYHLDREECRKRLGILPSEHAILSVGFLNFGKGFDRIIKALPALLETNHEYKLYIIGSEGPAGGYRQALRQLIDQLGLRDNVCFLGTVDNSELIFWYNAVDVFCLSSRSEGSPNVVMEALACGCPVVATDVGTVSEIITAKYMGKVVENSKEGVAEGLATLDYNVIYRQLIANDMKKFSWDWCAKQVNDFYMKALRAGE